MVAATFPTLLWPRKAVVASIAFHALVAAAVLSATISSVQTMPQQMIELSFEALPAAEQPLEVKTEAKKIPVVKKAAAQPIEKAVREEAEPQKLSAVSPAAGQPTPPPKAASIATTKPLFEAAYLRNPAPNYPAQAKRRGIEGSVMLSVLVSRDGVAASVGIAQSSGFDMLDEAAKEAVSRWKFIPAKRGEESVEARVMVPVEFRLQ